MPATTLAPLSTRRRLKRVKARVAAAVSIEKQLYLSALGRAENAYNNNFSLYVCTLIRQDIDKN